uniref:CG-1 domain-containing protein n=1 Tax=Aegilops tauschii subsp. strangulata TaxID=200361 RepID=A0A453MJ39_AEGTS
MDPSAPPPHASSSLDSDFDIQNLQHGVKTVWFKPREVLEILQNYERFPIQYKTQKPPSGSWFLFDRKVHRFYRSDGYQWQKRMDGKSDYEAHEYLEVLFNVYLVY